MKRFGIAFAGLAFGVFFTWLCLYGFSHINWPAPHTRPHGCYEIDHCAKHWWTYPAFFGSIFGPSLAFCLLNAIAWQRWTIRKWGWFFGAFVVLTALFYSAGFWAPLLR